MDHQSKPEEEAASVKCHNYQCWKDPSPGQLQFCAGCKLARYCSKGCQKQSWKDHKVYCKHVSSNCVSSATLDANVYYEKIAPHDPAVRALAREIGLPLPAPGGESHGLQYVMCY